MLENLREWLPAIVGGSVLIFGAVVEWRWARAKRRKKFPHVIGARAELFSFGSSSHRAGLPQTYGVTTCSNPRCGACTTWLKRHDPEGHA